MHAFAPAAEAPDNGAMTNLLPNTPRKRRPPRFSQRDLARAIKTFVQAGLQVAAVRIEADGALVIVPGTPAAVLQQNPWDAA